MNAAITYARRVALVACPFCRELFEEGEAVACPLCGVKLAAFEKLPPLPGSAVDDFGIPVAPEHERIPVSDMRRGKGAIAALAVVGLAVFFLPWVHMTMPDVTTYSGFDLARRLGWSWGAACSWVVLVPTVLSRQSIAQLRGARVAATFLAAVPAVTVSLLLARPPHGRPGIPVVFTWGWPMYATLAVSLLACAAALFLGGRVDDVSVVRGSSDGETLH